MDQREIFDSEHAVKADEAVSFQGAQKSVQFSGPMGESPAPTPALAPSPAPAPLPAPAPAPTPTPAPAPTTSCRTKGKKRGHSKLQTHVLAGDPGEVLIYLHTCFIGHSKPQTHVLTVDPGEDVMAKVMSLSLQAPHAICILSANGTISKVTIRGEVPGETSTFEGTFKILSLNGSFFPLENELTKRRGEMNVWFELLNGDVRVGALAGSMIAAGPVKVVVGSFLLPSHTPEKKSKLRKQKVEHKSQPH